MKYKFITTIGTEKDEDEVEWEIDSENFKKMENGDKEGFITIKDLLKEDLEIEKGIEHLVDLGVLECSGDGKGYQESNIQKQKCVEAMEKFIKSGEGGTQI